MISLTCNYNMYIHRPRLEGIHRYHAKQKCPCYVCTFYHHKTAAVQINYWFRQVLVLKFPQAVFPWFVFELCQGAQVVFKWFYLTWRQPESCLQITTWLTIEFGHHYVINAAENSFNWCYLAVFNFDRAFACQFLVSHLPYIAECIFIFSF